jgi:proline iminopeptidase
MNSKKVMIRKGVVEIDGFKLNYRIEGNGIPTLVVGSSMYYPRTFLGSLREHLQLIFIDIKGFVPSPPRELSTNDYELDILLGDIETMRQALGLEQFVIVGHSGLAFLALEYAKAYPDYVSQVVLSGNSPDFSAATAQARIDFFNEQAEPERKAAFAQGMAQLPAKIEAEPDRRFVHMCVCAGPISWYDYGFDATPLWEDVYTNMPIIDYIWGVIFRDIDITQGLETFDKPVFLALGKHDYLTGTPFLWESIRAQFKNFTVTVFEKSAHTPQYEEAALFNQTLINWVETTRSATNSVVAISAS